MGRSQSPYPSEYRAGTDGAGTTPEQVGRVKRMQMCCAAISLMLALTGSVPAQRIERLQGTNLLAGRKATFSVAPNCSHCRGGDETDLTDGKFWQSGSSTDFWAHEGAVGWEFGSLPGVMIRFDLGQVQPIRTLGFDTVSGRADVTFPAAVLAYVSDDGRTWHYVTDLINEALPESRFIRRRFVAGDHVTGALRTRGRHLAFYIVRGAGSTFVDEIEVLRGNRDPSEAVLESDGIATDQLEDDALNRARSTGQEHGAGDGLTGALECLVQELLCHPCSESEARRRTKNGSSRTVCGH